MGNYQTPTKSPLLRNPTSPPKPSTRALSHHAKAGAVLARSIEINVLLVFFFLGCSFRSIAAELASNTSLNANIVVIVALQEMPNSKQPNEEE